MEGGSTFQVNGNATNSGQIYTSFNGTGGNIFNITGNLTNTNFIGLESTDTATIGGTVNNSGSFQLTGGATATFTGTLTNTGTVDLENASTLKINGTADNFGTLSTSANGGTGGNTMTVSGLLTNEATGQLSVNGPSDVLKASAGLVNKRYGYGEERIYHRPALREQPRDHQHRWHLDVRSGHGHRDWARASFNWPTGRLGR